MAEGADRRTYERHETRLEVDVAHGDHFLFAYITNISEVGLFVHSEAPLTVGTAVRLSIKAGDHEPLELPGTVVWVNVIRPEGDNPNPGMGIRFEALLPEQRERLVDMIRTVAYLNDVQGAN